MTTSSAGCLPKTVNGTFERQYGSRIGSCKVIWCRVTAVSDCISDLAADYKSDAVITRSYIILLHVIKA